MTDAEVINFPGFLKMPTFAERFVWKIAEEKKVRREKVELFILEQVKRGQISQAPRRPA